MTIRKIIISLLFCLFSHSVWSATVTIDGMFTNITSGLPGGTNDPPDCFQSLQPGAPTYDNQIRYGAGSFSGSFPNCTLQTNQQSGMGHQGGNNINFICPQPGDSGPISLGVFTHYNNPIAFATNNSQDLLTGFQLDLSISDANNNINLSVPGFVFDETLNSAVPCPYPTTAEVLANPTDWPDSDGDGIRDINDPNPNSFNTSDRLCSDRVSLGQINSFFLFDDGTGNSCAMTVTGFSPCDDLSAQNVGDFTSKEGLSNNACVVAQLSDTVPVALSSVSSERVSDKLTMDWSTSSELFNVGFQLWGLDAKDSHWEKLHNWLIRSGSGNAVEPQSYSKTVRIPASITELVALGISSVDNDGTEHYYGPFDVGQSYGNLNSLEPIAWNHIRAQTDAQMRARGYIKDRFHGYRKVSSPAAVSNTLDNPLIVEFKIQQEGLYRISSKQLLAAGANWNAIAKRDIALVDYQGNALVRYVLARGSGSGQARTLGAQGEIFFHAQGVNKETGLYSDSSNYRLVLDRYKAVDAQNQTKRGVTHGYSEYYQAHTLLEQDNHYNLASAVNDPWLDAIIVSYADQTGSYAAALPVEADAMWNKDSTLTFGLGRSSQLPPIDNNGDGQQDMEHTAQAVVLSPNGVGGLLSLGSEQATGSGEWLLDFEIPGGTPLTLINNKVVLGGIFKPGSGYAFSEIHVDSIELTYARPYVAKAGENFLMFTAPADDALGYEVTVPDKGWPLVFAHSRGNLVRLALESQKKLTTSTNAMQRVVRFAALAGAHSGNDAVKYWVSGRGGIKNVTALSARSIVSKSTLLTQASGSDLLIIAHPAFMTESLSNYANFKRGQNYDVAIIDYLEIVDAFAGGQPGPWALTQYLSRVATQSPRLANVLIVGGSSYDHTDKFDTGAITFIPAHYGKSAYSKFTVSDAPYVQDSDKRIFASVGRWPVRSNDDLDNIIMNSMTWSTTDHKDGSALVIAENTVPGEEIDFAAALDGITEKLPDSWTTDKVYVDVIHANNPSLDSTQVLKQANGKIVSGLEAGPDVVLYNGHGTTSQLSNKGLFKAAEVAGINATGAQLWLPMSCYMTYYESTHANTLANQLLFKSNAVGISGSMLLSKQGENITTGASVLRNTIDSGVTIGEAVRQYKTQQNNSNLNINLNHLGDPTLKM